MAQADLPKAYDPQATEPKQQAIWDRHGVSEAEVNTEKQPFSIVIPPPNVTGALHMGHALDTTIQDLLIRWRRMAGDEALWLPGSDHAGIATQNVVEGMLAEEGLTRHDLGREKFVQRVWQAKEDHHGQIVEQLTSMGASCDWRRERFTLDEQCSRAVREEFVRLYEEGLIYRGRRIINWCPRCSTALSDIEVEDVEHQGSLWHICYPGVEGGEDVVVATTRPETMLGDTAVAVNPEDERYRGRVDQRVLLPLMERVIPIISDPQVDPEFGTGAVKITPAHDPNDFEIAQRHGLEEVEVIGADAAMTESAGRFAGMTREECRRAVVEALEQQGLLVQVEPHGHVLPQCSRCDTVVEPLVSEQWFVRAPALAGPAMEAVRDGRIRFVPERWTKVYMDWMEGLKDWCISRQLWWGHQLPVWYCQDCNEEIVAREDPIECPKCGGQDLEQHPDVLDTWFSSALWPFSTMGWPDTTPELEWFYPTSVLVTGYDIITFWVSRMIMMGLHFTGKEPFREVFIHGLIRDEKGRKESKSRGNVRNPLDLMAEYGTDALRFALVSLITHGQDMTLTPDKLAGSRHFCNKLWNAARFVLANLDGANGDWALPPEEELSLPDRWILSRRQAIVAEVNRHLHSRDLADAARGLYDFVWAEYCDWYLEMVKGDLQEGTEERKQAVRAILASVLGDILKMLHPIMPFITEEIWQHLRDGESVLALEPFPEPGERPAYAEEAEAQMEVLMEVIRAIRNVRADLGLARHQTSPVLLVGPEPTISLLGAHDEHLFALAQVSELEIRRERGEVPERAASAVVAGVEAYVKIEEEMNFEQEIARLERELGRVESDLKATEGKLRNEGFRAKAPAEVVAKSEARREELAAAREKLQRRLRLLKELSAP
ncbi:MAG: valine--tRNA ligase [Armatimonadota bacterium]